MQWISTDTVLLFIASACDWQKELIDGVQQNTIHCYSLQPFSVSVQGREQQSSSISSVAQKSYILEKFKSIPSQIAFFFSFLFFIFLITKQKEKVTHQVAQPCHSAQACWASYPVQYLGYCMMCHCFNPSHSIDLMLKNWTAQ